MHLGLLKTFLNSVWGLGGLLCFIVIILIRNAFLSQSASSFSFPFVRRLFPLPPCHSVVFFFLSLVTVFYFETIVMPLLF